MVNCLCNVRENRLYHFFFQITSLLIDLPERAEVDFLHIIFISLTSPPATMFSSKPPYNLNTRISEAPHLLFIHYAHTCFS